MSDNIEYDNGYEEGYTDGIKKGRRLGAVQVLNGVCNLLNANTNDAICLEQITLFIQEKRKELEKEGKGV